jgi:hypothetical protein
VDPFTLKIHSIHSKKGSSILQRYIDKVKKHKQFGGSDIEYTDYTASTVSISKKTISPKVLEKEIAKLDKLIGELQDLNIKFANIIFGGSCKNPWFKNANVCHQLKTFDPLFRAFKKNILVDKKSKMLVISINSLDGNNYQTNYGKFKDSVIYYDINLPYINDEKYPLNQKLFDIMRIVNGTNGFITVIDTMKRYDADTTSECFPKFSVIQNFIFKNFKVGEYFVINFNYINHISLNGTRALYIIQGDNNLFYSNTMDFIYPEKNSIPTHNIFLQKRFHNYHMYYLGSYNINLSLDKSWKNVAETENTIVFNSLIQIKRKKKKLLFMNLTYDIENNTFLFGTGEKSTS